MKNLTKLAFVGLMAAVAHIPGYIAIKHFENRDPVPKSYSCPVKNLTYCNKPNSRFGKGLRTNNLGYVSERDFLEAKDKDTMRVGVFGGSTSLPYCEQLTDKEPIANSARDVSYPSQLETLLSRALPEKKIEVWNMSVVGYSVREQALAFEALAPSFNFDIAIIQEPVNHIYLGYDTSVPWDQLELAEQAFNWRRLIAKDYLLEGLYEAVYRQRSRETQIPSEEQFRFTRKLGEGHRSRFYQQVQDGPLPTVLHSLERIKATADTVGTKLLLGAMPMIFTQDMEPRLLVPFKPGNFTYSETYQAYFDLHRATTNTYVDFGRANNLPVIRFDSMFEGRPVEELSGLFCDFIHPNKEAHAEIAKSLAKTIAFELTHAPRN